MPTVASLPFGIIYYFTIFPYSILILSYYFCEMKFTFLWSPFWIKSATYYTHWQIYHKWNFQLLLLPFSFFFEIFIYSHINLYHTFHFKMNSFSIYVSIFWSFKFICQWKNFCNILVIIFIVILPLKFVLKIITLIN